MITTVYGHRGIPEKYIENSIDGFKYIAQYGEAVEFDVQLTKDMQPVIMHDEKINRTTNGRGFIKDMTLDELQQVQLMPDRHRKNQLVTHNRKIPTLDEVLQIFQSTPLLLNIELKTDKLDYPGIEEIVLKKVCEYGLEERTIFSSFRLATIENMYQLAPKLKIALISRDRIKNIEHFMAQYHLSALHMKKTIVEPKWAPVERVWTINSDAEMQLMFTDNYAGFFTDDFEHALAIRAQFM